MNAEQLDRDWLRDYPPALLHALAALVRQRGEELYVTGGAVRNWRAGQSSMDLDLTVASDGPGWARDLAVQLGGAFVPLDEVQGVARVVWQGIEIDFCRFRGPATSLAEDLGLRDFTINAMAVAFDPAGPGLMPPYAIIDPTGGGLDFTKGVIRVTSPTVFVDDPLRLLRAFRFMAELGFSLEGESAALVRHQADLITKPAGERIGYELARIMASPRAAITVRAMADAGLLSYLFPELQAGSGVGQPASHHLDVLAHNLQALVEMERLQGAPADFFPEHGCGMIQYLADQAAGPLLKWAALFHDLGKPMVLAERDGRITFHQHDRVGAEGFGVIARRFAWRKTEADRVGRLIALHMWPFHLNNVFQKDGVVTPRACLRLVKAVGEELPGLFMLAMADSLAGQGPGKPLAMEGALARLYDQVEETRRQFIEPVLTRPRLLNGHDLRHEFRLQPGPVFSAIFDGLEEARVAGEVRDRDEAMGWVREFLCERQAQDF